MNRLDNFKNKISLLLKLFQLVQNTRKSREKILSLQQKKLRRLLIHAYNHSPFYHTLFDKAGINESNIKTAPLSAFPMTDKNLLMENYDQVLTNHDISQALLKELDESKKESDIHFVHSSGSTGSPRYFYYDKTAWNTMLAGIIRGAFWNMNIGEIMKFVHNGARLCYIAATNGNYGGAASIHGGSSRMGAEELYIDLNMPVNEWLPKIAEFKPNLLMGYPSALKILCDEIAHEDYDIKSKIDFSKICQLVTCGEPLSPSCRKYLEKTFGRNVINFYGASESLALGLESSSDSKMILFDDLNIIEEIDGKMYLTCLYNFSQPLIRYHISDRIEFIPACGSVPFSRCSVIQSREEDVMWFTDGIRREFVHPLSVEGFCIEGLTDYQFIQKDNDFFNVLLQTSSETDFVQRKNIGIKIKKEIQKVLDEKQLDFVHFEVLFAECIKPEANGKKKLIVRCA